MERSRRVWNQSSEAAREGTGIKHRWMRALMIVVGLVFSSSLRAEDAVHWAFRPVQRPTVPSVKHADLVESPVDAFILEQLEAKGLEPSGRADKRTLIRRATYDLIGLPPTPEEVAAFIGDESPNAFEKVVERLLQSPHYGERWGRHWLDVARYANTRGDTVTADPVNYFAFTYRDYVVRAFNDDKPYDRFLTEQIAADQLGQGENSPTLAALGFITVGRHFLSNIHDTIDDRIDVVTRGTMALTVTCARCHDHKYDPIPTRDYYSLYGVFASSNEPSPLPTFGIPDSTLFAEYQAEHAKLESKRTETIRQQEAEVLQRYRKLTAEFLLASLQAADPKEGDATPPDESDDAKLRRRGTRRWRKMLEQLKPDTDPIFAPWFAFAAIPEPEFAEKVKELAAKVAGGGLSSPVNPLVMQRFAGEPPSSLKDVAERYSELLQDAMNAPAPEANAPAADPHRESIRAALMSVDAPGHFAEGEIRKLFSPKIEMQIQQFATDLTKLDSEHPGAPLRAMALFDNAQPQNAKIFVRGNPNNPGPETPRQFLEVLAGANRQPFAQGSGRLELAKAIVSPDNPLTARVLVNRVWLHHFGEGLVTTPDDFGLRSDPPTHAALLDYLATRFMDERWSVKNLHRLVMLSYVYRQKSDDGLRYETVDSENRLLSKMNRRRLDFESLRDTLLSVAGNLDRTFGGRPVELTPQQKIAPAGHFMGESATPPTTRRAVYGFINRHNLPGLLRVFDFADPDTITGKRYITTVPQQALFFFNNPFVMQQACQLVDSAEFERLEAPAERVRYLYQCVFQREPSTEEVELALQYVAVENPAGENSAAEKSPPASNENLPRRRRGRSQLPQLTPWERYAHVLLMSDELMFVD